MKIKFGKTFYVNMTEFRGFVELHQVIRLLNEIEYKIVMEDITNDEEIEKIVKEYFAKYHMFCGRSYKKFSLADKCCSKICDGETVHTLKIKVNDKYYHSRDLGRTYYCYITDCDFMKKHRERIRVQLSPRLLKIIFNVEIID